ncbi:MAG: YabP/YqfC family sporulation protein [Candidatus Coproplasma sp.]
MKLLQQILSEAGADDARAFTIVPDFGGYFKCVKCIVEYSPEKITLNVGRSRVCLEGKCLCVGKYFQGDLFVSGSISGVRIE